MIHILLSLVMLIKVTLAADPWQSIVAILRKDVFVCEGGIISPLKVLTSCKCITNRNEASGVLTAAPATEIRVVAELVDLSKLGRAGFVTQAATVSPHVMCKMTDLLIEHDIGLITVKVLFPKRVGMEPLRPPKYNHNYKLKHFMSYMGTKNSTCELAGYGLTLASSKVLKTIDIYLLPFDYCTMALCGVGFISVCPLDIYSAKRQCAQMKNSNTSLCLKNGGSPIVCDGAVVGVISQGVEPWLEKDPATNCSKNMGDIPMIVARIDAYEFEQLFPVEQQSPKSCGMIIWVSPCFLNVIFSLFPLLFYKIKLQ